MATAKTECIVNGFPMFLNLQEVIQSQMAMGTYEPEQTTWVQKYLRSGDVFVDIGASFGYYTTLALSIVGKLGHVFSLEPSPVAYATIKHMADTCNIDNITLINAAVGRQNGHITLFMPPSEGLHSPSVFPSHEEYAPISVPLISLDSFEPVAAVDRIDMLKMDIEGSEPDALAGMKTLVSQGKIRRILCEFNSWWLHANNTSVPQLQNMFQEMGFVVEEATEWRRGIPAIRDETFDLQDVLYRYSGD